MGEPTASFLTFLDSLKTKRGYETLIISSASSEFLMGHDHVPFDSLLVIMENQVKEFNNSTETENRVVVSIAPKCRRIAKYPQDIGNKK